MVLGGRIIDIVFFSSIKCMEGTTQEEPVTRLQDFNTKGVVDKRESFERWLGELGAVMVERHKVIFWVDLHGGADQEEATGGVVERSATVTQVRVGDE